MKNIFNFLKTGFLGLMSCVILVLIIKFLFEAKVFKVVFFTLLIITLFYLVGLLVRFLIKEYIQNEK